MTKKQQNNDTLNKVLKILTWGLYAAPLAYSAYKIIKEYEVVEKAVEAMKPQVDSFTEKAKEHYESALDTAKEYVSSVVDSAKGSEHTTRKGATGSAKAEDTDSTN